MRRVAVGGDMRHATLDAVVAHLESAGWTVVPCGAAAGGATPWPEAAEQVARLVASGAVDTGVVCCWTGTGVSIAANKVPTIRAALCGDAETARGARRWNDANVLALSLRATSAPISAEILDAWLTAGAVDPTEAVNVAAVEAIERRYRDRAVSTATTPAPTLTPAPVPASAPAPAPAPAPVSSQE